MKTIALFAGTRPEVIKMLPLYKELTARKDVLPKMILTGQHRELAQDVMRIFGVEPELDMAVMQEGQTLITLVGKLSASLAEYLTTNRPDIILAQGDTTSAMMAGMFGFYAGIPVGHVEAGLRTGNLCAPFPEEFNRRVLTLAARWHFAPTKTAADNLRQEGVIDDVYIVGNTVIDAALFMASKETANTRALKQRFSFLRGNEKNAVLVTAHRRENFGDGIRSIAAAVKRLAATRPDLHFIIPVHPNPNVQPVFTATLQNITNVHLTDPMGYDEILYLMQRSAIILTDSGGIQEEAPSFNVPLLVLRNETERPEGIAAGCSILVGTHPETIEKQFLEIIQNPEIYQKMATTANPYGDGRASLRIADILCV